MINVTSPTRVDLAGGTLDCWPLYLFVGECVTVNLAIDIMTSAQLVVRSDTRIEVNIQDLRYVRSFANLRDFLSSKDNEILLLQHIVQYFNPNFGFEIRTSSESPIGGGLGGSSSLCISLIRAFHRALNIKIDLHAIVQLAHNIEAQVIQAPTGTQDYYPALMGGLNIIHYSCGAIKVEPLKVDLGIFEKKMILVYTGKSHHSGINNWQVIKSVIDKDVHTLTALKEIAKISQDTAQACRDEKWDLIPELFRSEFDSRIKLTSSFSSPEIENLRRLVMAEGEGDLKICGAGGGGCVMIWADSRHHERIIASCQKNGYHPLKANAMGSLEKN